VSKNKISLLITDEVIAERKKNWKQPALKVTKGVLYKYAMCVKDASEGCVTDEAASPTLRHGGGLGKAQGQLSEMVD
jgi:dihydroxyacid dehydratase/phosphogluconate dehydratase